MLHRGSDTKQAERAGMRDASPQGRDTPWRGSIHGSLTPQAACHQRQQEVTQMPDDELRELEAKRRKALWMLANISPGDSKAFDPLSILDDLELQERKDSPHADRHLSSTSFGIVSPCSITTRESTSFWSRLSPSPGGSASIRRVSGRPDC